MPQTPLERWSETERQSQWLREGSVVPTHAASWRACSGHQHTSAKCPLFPSQASAPKTLLLLSGFFLLQSWKFLPEASWDGFGVPRPWVWIPAESPPSTAPHPYL